MKKNSLEEHIQKNTSYDNFVKDMLVYSNDLGFSGEVYAC
jgi:hypothetical protein